MLVRPKELSEPWCTCLVAIQAIFLQLSGPTTFAREDQRSNGVRNKHFSEAFVGAQIWLLPLLAELFPKAGMKCQREIERREREVNQRQQKRERERERGQSKTKRIPLLGDIANTPVKVNIIHKM